MTKPHKDEWIGMIKMMCVCVCVCLQKKHKEGRERERERERPVYELLLGNDPIIHQQISFTDGEE